jgi:hypothetical protein
MKPPKTPAPDNSKIGDCVKELADKVLSYKPYIDELCKPGKRKIRLLITSPARETDGFRLYEQRFRAKAAMDELGKLVNKSKPVTVDPLIQQYFHDVFPTADLQSKQQLEDELASEEMQRYFADPLVKQWQRDQRQEYIAKLRADPTAWPEKHFFSMKEQWRANAAMHAVRIAKELLRFKRFLQDPSRWPEQGIVKKEREYVKHLLAEDSFFDSRHHIIQDYADMLKKMAAQSPDGVIRPKESWFHADTTSPLSPQDKFEHQFAHLCRGFLLEGVKNPGFIPIPQRLKINFDPLKQAVVIEIPNYFSLAASDFPLDVVAIRQIRQFSVVRPHLGPKRKDLRQCEASAEEKSKIIDFYYADIEKQLKDKHDLFVTEAQEKVFTEFRDNTIAQELATLGRRLLNNCGVPPANNDSRISELKKKYSVTKTARTARRICSTEKLSKSDLLKSLHRISYPAH